MKVEIEKRFRLKERRSLILVYPVGSGIHESMTWRLNIYDVETKYLTSKRKDELTNYVI